MRPFQTVFSIFVVLQGLLLTGCIGYYQNEGTSRPMSGAGDGVPFELQGVSWALMLNDEVVRSHDEIVSITFGDSQVSGYAGCNDFSAALTMVADNAFKIGSITSTKMLCRDMSAENLLKSKLPGLHPYEIFEHKLLLFAPDRSEPPVLTFSRIRLRGEPLTVDRVSE